MFSYLLSWIPARAQYQARKAARKPKKPPVFLRPSAAASLPRSAA